MRSHLLALPLALAAFAVMPALAPVAGAIASGVGLPSLGDSIASSGTANAARIILGGTKIKEKPKPYYRSQYVSSTVSDGSSVVSLQVEVDSDAGSESLDMVEANAWLHGSVSIDALPSADASLSLTLYDTKSTSLMTFSGSLGADGSVALTAKSTQTGGDCATKTGCDTSSTVEVDIELLAAEVFENDDGSYELTLDLAGADLYSLAYADLSILESDEVSTCDKSGCTTTGSSTLTEVEVGWDDIGSVWEAELGLIHEGPAEVELEALDERGKKIDKAKLEVGQPWQDGGEGISTLALDDDPLTRVGLWEEAGGTGLRALVITSEGWTTTSTLPESAELSLDGGDTLTIPVNSYQLATSIPVSFSGDPEKEQFQVTVDGVVVKQGQGWTDRGMCAYGRCFSLAADSDGGWTLSASAFAESVADLPSKVEIVLTSTLGAAKPEASSYTLAFDDELLVVFGNEVDFVGAPLAHIISGKADLLAGAAAIQGRKSLSKGKFYGSISRDGDGDLEVSGISKDEASADGSVVVGGAALSIKSTGGSSGEGTAPPVVWNANGSGTKNSASMTSGRPQLL